MKLTNFKIVPLILVGTALLVLSGCDKGSGTSSNSGIAGSDTVTEEQCLADAGYGTITINGRTWLDRNLGASEVAADTNDTLAYGDLYQWGRVADGHQVRTSDINDTLATTLDNVENTPWEGKFIVSNTPLDWVAPGVDDNGSLRIQSWSSPYDEITTPNQVCPCGYVVPTRQDFIDLNMTANPSVRDDFKLAYATYRYFNNGNLDPRAITVFWTTSTINNNQLTAYAAYIDNLEEFFETTRVFGFSVRCIKPQY